MSKCYQEVTKVTFIDAAGNIVDKYAFQEGAGGRVVEVIEANLPNAQIIEIVEGDLDDVPGAVTIASLTGALAISDVVLAGYNDISLSDADLAVLGDGETEILRMDAEATSGDSMVFRANTDQGDYLL